jgi:hypothetical protein
MIGGQWFVVGCEWSLGISSAQRSIHWHPPETDNKPPPILICDTRHPLNKIDLNTIFKAFKTSKNLYLVNRQAALAMNRYIMTLILRSNISSVPC